MQTNHAELIIYIIALMSNNEVDLFVAAARYVESR